MLLTEPLAWLAVVAATLLLRRQQVMSKGMVAFLIGGVLSFGFLFRRLAAERLDPSPVDFLHNLLHLIACAQ